MLANAVHGSSTAEKAQKVIQTFIGEVPEEEEEGGEGGEGATENGAGVSYNFVHKFVNNNFLYL